MKLTQRTTATGVTLNDTIIHVVNTKDTSQDPTGSSYKAPLSLLSPLFTGGTGGIGGSGTNNYVARWTPDGSTLGDSLIQDNGTRLSIGASIPTSSRLSIQGVNTDPYVLTIAGNRNGTVGIQSDSTVGGGTSTNTGIRTTASNSGGFNFGAYFSAAGTTGSTSIGSYSQALGVGSNYSVQLVDGTQAIGKFLKSVTSDGKANWANITSADTTGASDTFTSADGKIITVTNGLITSIV